MIVRQAEAGKQPVKELSVTLQIMLLVHETCEM